MTASAPTAASTSRAHRVGILVFDGVTLLDVAGPAEVFAESGRSGVVYDVLLVSADGAPVRTSTGVRLVADAAAADVGTLDTLLLPGADLLAGPPVDPTLVAVADALADRAARTVSVCTGAFLLAATGRLAGRQATTHWRHARTLAARHPDVAVLADALYVVDGPVATSAGVSAGIDLALALVESDHGPQVARDAARSLVVFLHRPGGQSQFSVPSRTPVPRSRPLRDVLATVAADPAGDYSVPRLAAAAGMSPRHLTRLFHAELGTTPARHVEAVRLEAAQALLDAGHTVGSAAARSGFGSEEGLRRAFVARLGVPPATYRRRFAGAGPVT